MNVVWEVLDQLTLAKTILGTATCFALCWLSAIVFGSTPLTFALALTWPVGACYAVLHSLAVLLTYPVEVKRRWFLTI
jgi:uncharacterized membrane protein YccC